MLNKKIIKTNAILFVLFGLLSLVFGLTGLGAVSVLFAGLNLLVAVVYLIEKNYQNFKTCLLIGGVLLLVGFGLCSVFPIN